MPINLHKLHKLEETQRQLSATTSDLSERIHLAREAWHVQQAYIEDAKKNNKELTRQYPNDPGRQQQADHWRQQFLNEEEKCTQLQQTYNDLVTQREELSKQMMQNGELLQALKSYAGDSTGNSKLQPAGLP